MEKALRGAGVAGGRAPPGVDSDSIFIDGEKPKQKKPKPNKPKKTTGKKKREKEICVGVVKVFKQPGGVGAAGKEWDCGQGMRSWRRDGFMEEGRVRGEGMGSWRRDGIMGKGRDHGEGTGSQGKVMGNCWDHGAGMGSPGKDHREWTGLRGGNRTTVPPWQRDGATEQGPHPGEGVVPWGQGHAGAMGPTPRGRDPAGTGAAAEPRVRNQEGLSPRTVLYVSPSRSQQLEEYRASAGPAASRTRTPAKAGRRGPRGGGEDCGGRWALGLPTLPGRSRSGTAALGHGSDKIPWARQSQRLRPGGLVTAVGRRSASPLQCPLPLGAAQGPLHSSTAARPTPAARRPHGHPNPGRGDTGRAAVPTPPTWLATSFFCLNLRVLGFPPPPNEK